VHHDIWDYDSPNPVILFDAPYGGVMRKGIAQAAKTAGYATGHFGKWHLNGVAGPGKVILNSDPLSPRNVGFDESFSVSNYFEQDWIFGRNGVAEKAAGDAPASG